MKGYCLTKRKKADIVLWSENKMPLKTLVKKLGVKSEINVYTLITQIFKTSGEVKNILNKS